MRYYLILFLVLFGCVHKPKESSFLSVQMLFNERVEGEAYHESKNTKVEDMTHLGYFDKGSWAKYEEIDFLPNSNTIKLNVAGENSGGKVEFRIDSIDGPLLGTFIMKDTGSWYTFTEQSLSITPTSGVHDLYIIGVYGHGIFNLDWFEVNKKDVDYSDPLFADRSKGEWTLVVVPDTQHYSQDRGNAPHWHMLKGFEWIVEKQDDLNIKFVQGLGDITENWNDRNEWDRSFEAWDKLHDKVAYMPVIGNHDSPSTFNYFFPISKFSSSPYWGGYKTGSQNTYFNMDIGKEKYIFLQIQPYTQYQKYDPTGIDWAKSVLQSNSERKVILATHDTWDSKHIKDQLLNNFDNIVMSNAGHTCAREQHYITRNSNNFITDYQCDQNEIMLLRYYVFHPLEDKVYYYTFSPVTGAFEVDGNSQGSFDLVQDD